MVKLLISVRSVEEARLAMEGGADVIDIKEPLAGPLGAASIEVVEKILVSVGRRCTTSFACGELLGSAFGVANQWSTIRHSPPSEANVAATYIKAGLAGCGSLSAWREKWKGFLSLLPPGSSGVPVAYADWQKADAPAPADVIAQAVATLCPVVLLDTFDKRGAGLFECWSTHAIAAWIAEVHDRGMQCAVGGRLTFEDARRLTSLGPDFIAVRGGVCLPDRHGRLALNLVARWSRMTSARHRRASPIGPLNAFAGTKTPLER